MKLNSNFNKTQLVGPVIGLILMLICFVSGALWQCSRTPETPVETKTETVTKTDTVTQWRERTITVNRPIPVAKTITRVERDTLLTTQILHDTDTVYTPVTVDIPISSTKYAGEKTLSDSTRVEYEATVSGYKPALDSLQFKVQYPERQINTSTVTVTTETRKKHFGIAPSLGVGWGLVNKKMDVFVGLSIFYSF